MNHQKSTLKATWAEESDDSRRTARCSGLLSLEVRQNKWAQNAVAVSLPPGRSSATPYSEEAALAVSESSTDRWGPFLFGP